MDSPIENKTFFNRASELPVVQSATGTANSWYNWAKDSNQYVNTGLNLLEQQASAAAVAVANHEVVATKLVALDNAAVSGLDKLVKQYPVLSEPTEKIMADSRDAVTTYAAPYTTPATAMISSTQQAVLDRAATAQAAFDAAKERTKEAVVAITEYSNAISQKVGLAELDAYSAKVVDSMQKAQDYVAHSVEASRLYATAQYEAATERVAHQRAVVVDTASTCATQVNQYTETRFHVHVPQNQDELKVALNTLVAEVSTKTITLQTQVTDYVNVYGDRARSVAKGYGYEVPSNQELADRFSALAVEVSKNFDVALNSVKVYMAPITSSLSTPAPSAQAA